MPNEYVSKIVATNQIWNDHRTIVNNPLKPSGYNVPVGNPSTPQSGFRVNATLWPSGT